VKSKKIHDKTVIENAKPFSHWLGIAIILILGMIIYSNSFDCSFQLDDKNSIINNKTIQEGAGIQSIWDYSHNRFFPYYSFSINYQLGGLEVWGYHFVNLCIHLINACLVYWICLLIFATGAMKTSSLQQYKNLIAFFTALFFVSHPLATQSVTYIVQRMASMVTLFYLLSIALYIKSRITEVTNSKKYMYLIGSVIAGIMSFLTKENAFTLPLTILLVEYCFLQKNDIKLNYKDYRIYVIPIAIIALIAFAISYFSTSIFKSIPPSFGNDYTITATNYLLTQFSVIVKYIQLLLVPLHQNLDYDFPISNSIFETRTLLSLLVLMGVVAFGFYQYNKNRLISFGIFWFLITLSIESSIVPIADVIFEHRTYLPSFGFFIILSSIIFTITNKLKNGKLYAISIITIIVVINSGLTFARNKVWKTGLTLWSDVITKSPQKARPYSNRGSLIEDEKQMPMAIVDFNKAIAINPKYPEPYFNRGNTYRKIKENNKAIADYLTFIELNNQYRVGNELLRNAYYNMGVCYFNMKLWENAIGANNEALKIDDYYVQAYINRGVAYAGSQQFEKSIADYNKAIELDPGFSNAFTNKKNVLKQISNRGFEAVDNQNWLSAIADFSILIKDNPREKTNYYFRGYAYGKNNQWKNAIADYTAAIKLDNAYVDAHYKRAFAYIQEGLLANAIADYDKVIELEPDNQAAVTNRALALKNLNK
jgi:tetratricopeptide (TPR) repeat protein